MQVKTTTAAIVSRPDTNRLSSWWRYALWVLVASLALGSMLAFALICAEAWRYSSAARQYSAIQIGMLRPQVKRILSSGGIVCGLNYDSAGTQCTFSDFWRDYIVELDPVDGKVVHKGFQFRGHPFDLRVLAKPLRSGSR